MSGNISVKRTVADGAGAVEADIIRTDFASFTLVASVSAGTADVEFTCDPAKDLDSDPDTGITWVAWPPGALAANTLSNEFQTSVTAVRIKPVGGVGELRLAAQA